MARGSSTLVPNNRRQYLLSRHPYHKLDQIQEDDDSDDERLTARAPPRGFYESFQEKEPVEPKTRGGQSKVHASPVQVLRSKMVYSSSSRGRSSASSTSYRRRIHTSRWSRRVRLRICRVRLISWLSPMEFLKKLRKVYFQAISSRDSQCGLVLMTGAPWSFPVVVPFRGV